MADPQTETPSMDARFLQKIASDAMAAALANGGGGGHHSGMEERVIKIESAVESLRHTQNIVWGGVIGVAGLMLATAAVVVTLQFYVLSEVNGISDKIATEFRSMRAEQSAQTSAIANAITATKQQAPQVILVPAPQVQQPPQQ